MTSAALAQISGVGDSGRAMAVVAVMVLAIGALVVLRGWIVAFVRGGQSDSLRADHAGSAVVHGGFDASASAWDRDRADTRERLSSLGWLPLITFVSACSLYLVVYGYTLSRAGESGGEPWFWLGIAGIVGPIGMRLASGGVRTLERVLLVVSLVVLLYLVKVTHDPFSFTFADELVHLANVEHVLNSGELPAENTIIPVSARYPGLVSAASAVALLTGLGGFGAGLIVIGLARVVLALGLFVFFHRITGSARFAGLGVVFYSCTVNYLFWDAQFAYQSLAFPLAAVALAAVVSRRADPALGRFRGQNLLWTVVAIVATLAVTLTHHLTSYMLAGLMLVLAIAASLSGRRRAAPKWLAPWDIAAIAILASGAWLVFKAGETTEYLGPIFGTAIGGGVDVVFGEEGTRELFATESGYTAPSWERLLSLGAVALTTAGIVIGAWKGGRIFGSRALFGLLAFVSFGYVASFGLRLLPSAWEVANRMSDYAFVAVAALLAAATIHFIRQQWGRAVGPMVLGVTVGVLMIGATLTSWPASVRLPLPYRVAVADETFTPESDSVASWSREALGPARRFVADGSNGRVLLLATGQVVYVARTPNARVFLEEPEIDLFQLGIMRELDLEYVVVDRRLSTDDNMAGYFFDADGVRRAIDTGERSTAVLEKFEEEPVVSRLLDTGNSVVYDVRPLRDALPRD